MKKADMRRELVITSSVFVDFGKKDLERNYKLSGVIIYGASVGVISQEEFESINNAMWCGTTEELKAELNRIYEYWK